MDFDLILKGNKEFTKGLNNKTYRILKVDSKEKIKFMTRYFTDFIKKAKTSRDTHYIGIDFEFNRVGKSSRDVALMQINLENNSNNSNIFVLYPPELAKPDLDVLIELVSEPSICKILHGAESLDIPYLFHQLLENKDQINGLCTGFYDTKYLCDYAHIESNKKSSCSIYHLLVENNVISNKKFNELENIENITGPIYLINIDIHKLSHDVFRYSLYDVLYLPELIKKYIVKGYVYAKLIPEITCIINKYKRKIEFEFLSLEQLIGGLNIAYVLDRNNRILLHEIWESFYYFVSDSDNYIVGIKQIQSFKHFFEIITKMIIYTKVLELYTVFKSKNTIIEALSINFSPYYKWLESYPNTNLMFKNYQTIISEEFNIL